MSLISDSTSMEKEKQPLMDQSEVKTPMPGLDLTNNEPKPIPTNVESEHIASTSIQTPNKGKETKTSSKPRWSVGSHYPDYETTQKTKVLSDMTKPTKIKPDSLSENNEIPGLWPTVFNHEICTIYRVPNRLRKVNPEAYTPQMLLIGPLHHSKKAEALKLAKTDLRYLDYINMELHKKKYSKLIANYYGSKHTEFVKAIILRTEKLIRQTYAESTDWIESKEFVEMIIHDSMFVIGFLIQTGTPQNTNTIFIKEDIIFHEPCLMKTILEDLMLLENQLPYWLLENLFRTQFQNSEIKDSFRDITLQAFGLKGKIRENVGFLNFTDLFRRVRIETLGLVETQISTDQSKNIKSLHNADKLDSVGVDFLDLRNDNDDDDLSLVIKFERGILKMPCFIAEDNTERVMRNLMALEQCHYPKTAVVCNYITFLDFLIDTEQDVDLLVKKGVVKNWLGHQGSVAEMVNKLSLGIVVFGSYYYPISEALNKHYESRFNRSAATLRRVYFKDLWTGTATVAAVVLLLLTLTQTITSILQVI